MSAITDTMPVDAIRERAGKRQFRPGYAAVTVIGAVLAAGGWLLGRGLVVTGWVLGRTWLALAFMAEAVVYGFRQGAMLGADQPSEPAAPPRPSKL